MLALSTTALVWQGMAGFLMSLSVLVVLFCQVQKLYEFRPRAMLAEAFAVCRAVGLATIVLSAVIYLSGQKVVSRVALGITVFMSAFLLISWRLVWHWLMKRAAEGADRRNVLIFGWSQSAQVLDDHVEYWLPGYAVKDFSIGAVHIRLPNALSLPIADRTGDKQSATLTIWIGWCVPTSSTKSLYSCPRTGNWSRT
jgi:hypothetical protein